MNKEVEKEKIYQYLDEYVTGGGSKTEECQLDLVCQFLAKMELAEKLKEFLLMEIYNENG